jgi:tagatose 6-phosphate kinase
MILCVSLSPAVDITYRVDRLVVGGTNRVGEIGSRPGGKAVNVARVLHQLGEPVCVLAPVGGTIGDEFAAELRALGVPTELVRNGRPTRRTVTVTDSAGSATVLNEPAEIDCWDSLLTRVASLVPEAAAVVISGSLPAGVPTNAMSTVVTMAHNARRPVLVDTSGPALADALSAAPSLIKPNADELAELAHEVEPGAAARELARTGHTLVVASLGADGVVAASADHAWRLKPARSLAGNPTGAGDALVAGLARGLRTGAELPAMLRDAVALSAAAVRAPFAGEIDLDEYVHQCDGVTVQTLDAVS